MFRTITILIGLGLNSIWAQGSFAPNASTSGTTAMHRDSSAFVNWAIACTVQRGPQDISQNGSPLVATGDDHFAIGKSGVNGVVSLGDGGTATLTFAYGIVNGPGPDFAVFENAFNNDFLELAFVEVSSNGVDFVRFPAISEIQDTLQTDPFGNTNATEIYNLAGKYRSQYGTPFDLDDLTDTTNINLNWISHVRIVDVVGSINEAYATFDVNGRKINDPFPTDFPSGGFDLDAVGVINESPVSIQESERLIFTIYPNPARDQVQVTLNNPYQHEISVFSISGQLILNFNVSSSKSNIDIADWPSGVYLLKIGNQIEKLIVE